MKDLKEPKHEDYGLDDEFSEKLFRYLKIFSFWEGKFEVLSLLISITILIVSIKFWVSGGLAWLLVYPGILILIPSITFLLNEFLDLFLLWKTKLPRKKYLELKNKFKSYSKAKTNYDKEILIAEEVNYNNIIKSKLLESENLLNINYTQLRYKHETLSLENTIKLFYKELEKLKSNIDEIKSVYHEGKILQRQYKYQILPSYQTKYEWALKNKESLVLAQEKNEIERKQEELLIIKNDNIASILDDISSILNRCQNHLKHKRDIELVSAVQLLYKEELDKFKSCINQIDITYYSGKKLRFHYQYLLQNYESVYSWILDKKGKIIYSNSNKTVKSIDSTTVKNEVSKLKTSSTITNTESVENIINTEKTQNKNLITSKNDEKIIANENTQNELISPISVREKPNNSEIKSKPATNHKKPKDTSIVKNVSELILSDGEIDSTPVEKAKKTSGPKNIDYVALSKITKDLGIKGELYVLKKEKEKLQELNKFELINKVRHIATEKDNPGYDIISYDENGNELLIEVKTTKGGYYSSPFYLSENELNALANKTNYYIYRVYNFDMRSEIGDITIIKGMEDLSNYFNMETMNFKASVKV